MLIISLPVPEERQQTGYLLQPSQSNNAIDVFDPIPLLELRRAARLGRIFKTSFSRLNPVPRGQATVIRSFIRHCPKGNEQPTIQSDKLPTYLQPLHHIRPARPSMVSQELGSDTGQNPTPGSLQINLLFTIYAEQASGLSRCKLFTSSEDIAVSLNTNRFGGAERDRTADPLLAKQVLSQLSYSPNHFKHPSGKTIRDQY
jgi:hypothetical protein